MRSSIETAESRIITAGGLVASFLVGFVAVRYTQQRSQRWFKSRFQQENEIRIDSGKEGIQPKHNKPKFFQMTG